MNDATSQFQAFAQTQYPPSEMDGRSANPAIADGVQVPGFSQPISGTLQDEGTLPQEVGTHQYRGHSLYGLVRSNLRSPR